MLFRSDSLSDAGIVETSRGARGQVEVALTRPAETERFLREVSPSLADRLVDRFVGLVDGGRYGAADADD